MATDYDDSDLALVRQVDVAEIDALLAGPLKAFAKQPRALAHLLTRVRSTLLAAHETVAGLRRHVQEQNAYLARVGTPTTLNPLDAVRYLDDEQKELIFDRIARDRLRNLRRLVARAEAERAALVADAEVVRSVARALSEQTDLPPYVRAQVTRQLAALPREISAVHHPPMLDYPDTDAPNTDAPAAADPAPAVAPVPVPARPSVPPADAAPARPAPVPATFVDPYAPAHPEPVFLDPYAASPAHPGEPG